MNRPVKKPEKSTATFSRWNRGGYIEKPQNFKKSIKKLFSYLKPYSPQIIFSGSMSILSSLLTVIAPWLLGLMTTEIAEAFIQNRSVGSIYITSQLALTIPSLALIVLLGYSLGGILAYLQSFILTGMTQNLTFEMRKEIAKKINNLPLSHFDKQSFGDVLGRSTNDIETISATINKFTIVVFPAPV